jgi:5-methylcytosine-specific restriction enzyme A
MMALPVYGHTWKRVRLEVLARDHYECQIRGPRCQGRATLVDHIIPVARGGAWYDQANLRASCRSCNTARAYAGFVSRSRPSREW